MVGSKKETKSHIGNLVNSITKYISKGKEEELREKVSNAIKEEIFSKDIEIRLNARDFSSIGLLDNSTEELAFLFSTIFPVLIDDNGSRFRLYKHKIEIALSGEMDDRFIYILSDGRLTSGEFKCYRLYDDEYVYIVKRIIQNIPRLRERLKLTLKDLDKSIDDTITTKKQLSEQHLDKAKENAGLLLKMLGN
ncbi:hypothetical protein Clopa_3495 [Clostridium pasteurianum BC1]|uniref:Uncharacterized protein n=1 Tax=Clostridium pasteurianum BC1 TaxID=86416 RepID=R4KFA0_CLOPA|nr:hypothetical protein Clopa_3495 [Clostridium pasteurianum BC1]